MIRVANAPCSWGILEFDRTVTPVTYQQVIDEISRAGYAGTELGDWGFLPTDPSTLRHEIERYGLRLIAAFVPVALAKRAAHADGMETAVRTASLLRDADGPEALIVLSDDNGRVPLREQNAGRITADHGLGDPQWAMVAEGAEAIARAVKDQTGLRTVFHPHCGGYVETEAEIDQLMKRTDPTLLGLCLDTGHIKYAGGDPVAVLKRYTSRIWHVHFKDCDDAVASHARAVQLGYLAAVRNQLFCELGRGAVDFAKVVETLQQIGYDGWIVVEQDVFPGYGAPEESARRSRDFLRGLGI
jgi:inosose dehydratase